jgi:hypothetical protein
VYTCDINPVRKLADNHTVIIKNALDIEPCDVDNKAIDMIFFDCHDMVQMDIYKRLVEKNIINDDTILALHDTNLHYKPWAKWGKFIPENNGVAHQPVEREMSNIFKDMGYDLFNLNTDSSKHSNAFPIRHGITICSRVKKFSTNYL